MAKGQMKSLLARFREPRGRLLSCSAIAVGIVAVEMLTGKGVVDELLPGAQHIFQLLKPILTPTGAVLQNAIASDSLSSLDEQLSAKEALKNYDLAKLVGGSIGEVIREEARDKNSEVVENDKAELKRFAKYVPKRWLEFSELEDHQSRYKRLSEPYVPKLLTVTAAEFNKIKVFSNKRTWINLLEYLNLHSDNKTPYLVFDSGTFPLLAERLDKRFIHVLRAKLKADAASGGLAYPGLSLMMLGQILAVSQKVLKRHGKLNKEMLQNFEQMREAISAEGNKLIERINEIADRQKLRYAEIKEQYNDIIVRYENHHREFQNEVVRELRKFGEKVEFLHTQSIRISQPLLKQLEASRDLALVKNKRYRTPYLLRALLDSPMSFAASCLDEVEVGLADLVRDKMIAYEGNDDFQQFDWQQHAEIIKAREIVRAEGGSLITDRHLLLAICESDSRTIHSFREYLGAKKFQRLITVIKSRDDNSTALGFTPQINWNTADG